MLIAVLHFIPDNDDPYGIVARLVAALPSGSYVALSHATGEYLSEAHLANMASGRHGPFWPRNRERLARFFDGLEILTPGIVSTSHWRADDEPQPRPSKEETSTYSAVARIP